VGGRYSDEWHRDHLTDPRSVVPESIMPGYGFLRGRTITAGDIGDDLKANAAVGVPYSGDMIANASADFTAQASATGEGADALLKRYPKAQARDFDGNPDNITEMDALIAYLQMLGTLVDFNSYKAEANLR
jgi:cytochrome c oxidase cbb3-type subunit 2